jgi:hypothetical protein
MKSELEARGGHEQQHLELKEAVFTRRRSSRDKKEQAGHHAESQADREPAPGGAGHLAQPALLEKDTQQSKIGNKSRSHDQRKADEMDRAQARRERQ